MRGPETQKLHLTRLHSGFYARYMQGKGLDIGYRGNVKNPEKIVPVLDTATGVDLDYPGYDGVTLPFEDSSQDYVFASHILEHVEDVNLYLTIEEWFRVLKPGGYMIICVPHQELYERQKVRYPNLRSRWNEDHKRSYTSRSLLAELEDALGVRSNRIVHLKENDEQYDYTLPIDKHAVGCYDIECVVRKL